MTVEKRKKIVIVIPEATAFIIEQTAIYNDAIEVYMLSLYRRSLLGSRL